MNDSILISVIVPTYNSSITLTRCLDSIVSQDHVDKEIWLIDGGSVDDTLLIIGEYCRKYPFVHYISEPDRGIYDAMNKGVRLAAGDWIYFLGSDDELYANSVFSAVAETIKTANCGVVYGNVVMRGKNQWNLDNVVFDGEYDIKKFIDRNICHQSMFFKKKLLNLVGDFDLKYVTNADFDMNLRCYAVDQFTYVDLIVANFFVGGQSTLVDDHEFHNDRGALLMKYFGGRIFGNSFVGARLYIQQAGFSATSPLGVRDRIFCITAYVILKLRSMLPGKP